MYQRILSFALVVCYQLKFKNYPFGRWNDFLRHCTQPQLLENDAYIIADYFCQWCLINGLINQNGFQNAQCYIYMPWYPKSSFETKASLSLNFRYGSLISSGRGKCRSPVQVEAVGKKLLSQNLRVPIIQGNPPSGITSESVANLRIFPRVVLEGCWTPGQIKYKKLEKDKNTEITSPTKLVPEKIGCLKIKRHLPDPFFKIWARSTNIHDDFLLYCNMKLGKPWKYGTLVPDYRTSCLINVFNSSNTVHLE